MRRYTTHPRSPFERSVLGVTRMSLLEHPDAQALLADADVSAAAVRSCGLRLEAFLHRYLPRFYREEQRDLAHVVLQGKLSKLERKTSEPIAYLAGCERKPVQHFVGAGAWDDEAPAAAPSPRSRRLRMVISSNLPRSRRLRMVISILSQRLHSLSARW